jgi:LuxR family maltose regulon positive regulatory protein
MGEAGRIGLSPQVATLFNPVPSQRARLLLAQGDVHAAAQWTTAAGLSPDDEPNYPQEPAYLVLARVLLAHNDPGPALTLLQRLLDAAASQSRTGSIIEIQALRLIAAGRSNQRIAHDLVVALDTVKKHVTHLLGKLGAANRTEAAARARQLGLIP